MNAFHSTTFPASMPVHEHLPLWRHATRHQCAINPLRDGWQLLDDAVVCNLGSLLFTHQHNAATHFRRSPEHCAATSDEWIIARLTLSGCYTLQFDDGRQYHAGAGSVLVHDWSVPHEGTSTDYRMLTIGIRRPQLAAARALNTARPVIVWEPKATQARLLAAAISGLHRDLTRLDAASAAALEAGITGLVDGVLCAELGTDPPRRRTPRGERIRHYIHAHLRDPDLDAEQLCRRFHCSRATLYRVFDTEGGVTTYIQKQRLQACLQQLNVLPGASRAMVAQLCESWGFASLQQFQRVCRQMLGYSLEDVLSGDALAEIPGLATEPASPWARAEALGQQLQGML